ncbi:endonuclease VII domain-containing protein [Streptomyces sp. A5-4]|uniref:endonuclease VII domain-containing protein n=1 Tax=Streptomyces sp. A5-4 TaxID=3384771 RepID=UPI003DA7AD31
MNEYKRCSRCQRTLQREVFASNRSTSDGLQGYCKECAAEYYRQRQEAKGRAVRAKVPVPRGSKRCPQCGEIKAHSEWELNSTTPDGYASYCKVGRAGRNQQSYFKRKYGITMAERDDMISSQMGICSICLSAPAVHVDHCHTTGSVQGVLCFNCNSAIGKLRDDPDTLRRAAAYLEGNAWKPTLVAPGVYQLPS